MPKPPGAVGEAVESGSLYRLIPNWSGYWDYERGMPEARAFRKDGDLGVSMLVAQRITPEQIFAIKPWLQEFAICEIVIEALHQERDVWVKLDPDDDWGDAREAHVLVMNITKRRVDWLRDLGRQRIVKLPGPPGPMVRSPSVDGVRR